MKSNSSEVPAPSASLDTRPTARGFLRWLANYGLSLSAADYVLQEDRQDRCPFAQLRKTEQNLV